MAKKLMVSTLTNKIYLTSPDDFCSMGERKEARDEN